VKRANRAQAAPIEEEARAPAAFQAPAAPMWSKNSPTWRLCSSSDWNYTLTPQHQATGRDLLHLRALRPRHHGRHHPVLEPQAKPGQCPSLRGVCVLDESHWSRWRKLTGGPGAAANL